jgi:predicted PurR-regulated permease PerM
MNDSSEAIAQTRARRAAIVDLVVQIACLALLLYWAVILVKPFLTIMVWSIILAVVLYPLFDWMVRSLHINRVAAALLITLVCLVILFGPAAWLGLSLIETVRSLAERLGSGDIALPPPPDSVKDWPLIGDNLYASWSLASTNLKAALVQIGPQFRPISGTLLELAGNAGISMLKFIIAVVISGFLLLPGPQLVSSARLVFRRIAAGRGDEFVDLIGVTIRNLARGVIGVSLLQALLAGVGLIVAGFPAAGFLSFLILVLGIIQIDALLLIVPLIVWGWLKFDVTSALMFSVYMIPVGLLNNLLRPFVMAHGLKTPMLVILIGVIGGILTHGVIGLFVGPIVLAIAWELLREWTVEAADRWKAATPAADK